MVLGCVCMSVGYLSIIILRNKPSDLGFPELIEDEPEQRLNEIYDENSEQESDSEEKEEKEFSRLEQTKLMLNYPFFASLCLVYLLVQLIKTIYSDVSQMYLIKVIKIDPYRGRIQILNSYKFENKFLLRFSFFWFYNGYYFPLQNYRIKKKRNITYSNKVYINNHLYSMLDSCHAFIQLLCQSGCK